MSKKNEIMSEKKQTALDYYSDKLFEILGEMCNQFTQEQTLRHHYLLKEAKEMEREQIKESFDLGISSVLKNFDKAYSEIDGDKYYEDTYQK